jgi:hypothetical protein
LPALARLLDALDGGGLRCDYDLKPVFTKIHARGPPALLHFHLVKSFRFQRSSSVLLKNQFPSTSILQHQPSPLEPDVLSLSSWHKSVTTTGKPHRCSFLVLKLILYQCVSIRYHHDLCWTWEETIHRTQEVSHEKRLLQSWPGERVQGRRCRRNQPSRR